MKDAYYFSHDSNSRNDPKILNLRMELGMRGYGIFWSIIEMLRDEETHKMQLQCKRIAFELHEDSESVEQVINNFGLFKIEGEFFWSESLLKRMEMKDQKSETARKNALLRWNKPGKNKSNAKPMQTHSNGNASKVKESKEKESKLNKNISIYTVDESFSLFDKSSINGRFFSKMNQVHGLNENVIQDEFKKWKEVNQGNNFESESHLQNSFNNWLRNYKPKSKTVTNKLGKKVNWDEI